MSGIHRVPSDGVDGVNVYLEPLNHLVQPQETAFSEDAVDALDEVRSRGYKYRC